MKRLAAAGLTAILLLMALRANDLGDLNEHAPGSAGTTEYTPIQVVERSFSTAEQGDLPGYLALFSGTLRSQLEREMSLQGAENYRATLKQGSAGLKGRVIEPVAVTATQREVTVRIERVYALHHERQWLRLSRGAIAGNDARSQADARWQIVERGPIERFQPRVPYGTPTAELESP